MLFGNSYIEGAIWKCGLELIKTGWSEHRCGNCNNIFTLSANLHELTREDRCPRRSRLLKRLAGLRINNSHRMKLLGFIIYGRCVAATLLGDDMHQNRSLEILCVGKGTLHRLDIVTIYRTKVLKSEIFKHSLWRDNIFDALFNSMQGLINGLAYNRGAL